MNSSVRMVVLKDRLSRTVPWTYSEGRKWAGSHKILGHRIYLKIRKLCFYSLVCTQFESLSNITQWVSIKEVSELIEENQFVLFNFLLKAEPRFYPKCRRLTLLLSFRLCLKSLHRSPVSTFAQCNLVSLLTRALHLWTFFVWITTLTKLE